MIASEYKDALEEIVRALEDIVSADSIRSRVSEAVKQRSLFESAGDKAGVNLTMVSRTIDDETWIGLADLMQRARYMLAETKPRRADVERTIIACDRLLYEGRVRQH